LRQRIDNWAQNKEKIKAKEIKPINYHATAELLSLLKKQEEYSWLKENNSQSLQGSLWNLDTAFKKFFRKTSGFPKFKKKSSKQTCPFFQGTKIVGNKIKLIKFAGGIRFVQDREINGRILGATVSKVPSGKYFISILVDEAIEKLPIAEQSVGIDLGIKTFAYCSNGKEFVAPNYKNGRKTIEKHQRHLSRKKKGSRRHSCQRIKLARKYEKAGNIRKDFLQKTSTKLIRENQTIYLEDLNIKGMMKNPKLARVIGEQGWYSFVSMLEYKAKWYGREIVKINRFHPSSKMCSDCGFVNEELQLKDREWTCSACGVNHLRDWNASKNILSEGLRSQTLQSVGSTDNRRGKKFPRETLEQK
jgi:putative transposase